MPELSCSVICLSVYSSTKAALISLSKTFAADLADKGIRVNAILPGYIATLLSKKVNAGRIEAISAGIPLGKRFGQPEEIAYAALFFASEMSTYITGQTLIVDGGLSTLTHKPKKM